MGFILIAVGGILGLVGLVGHIWVLVEAFKDDATQGILCLCVPCYILYYAFARLESENKGLILGLWLGCGITGNVLSAIGQNMMAHQ